MHVTQGACNLENLHRIKNEGNNLNSKYAPKRYFSFLSLAVTIYSLSVT